LQRAWHRNPSFAGPLALVAAAAVAGVAAAAASNKQSSWLWGVATVTPVMMPPPGRKLKARAALTLES